MTGATISDSVEQQKSVKTNSAISNASDCLTTDTMGGAASAVIKICSTFEYNEKIQTNNNCNEQNNENENHTCNKNFLIWNYNEDDLNFGPCSWPITIEVKCGKRQSPIDLKLSAMRPLIIANDPLKFVNYSNLINGEFMNTGHSIQFMPEAQINCAEIYGGMLDQRYRFIQYHYHWGQINNYGSEHTFNSLHYSAELHLVHQGIDNPNKIAVLGVFLNVDKSANGIAFKSEEAVLDKLVKFNSKVKAKPQKLQFKIPENTAFVRYSGSLTTPPCTENVTWTIFTDPIAITPEQISLLRRVRGHCNCVINKNCRPLQKLNDRVVHLAI